jgi:hypothetical protein
MPHGLPVRLATHNNCNEGLVLRRHQDICAQAIIGGISRSIML